MEDINSIREKVRRVLVESPALEGIDPETILDDTPLAETLGLDSVDALEIVIGLEKTFGLKVDATALDRENFHSINKLSDFLQGQLEVPKQAS
ncbi:MAG: acyl carrier protein [Planctomycetota bacterium]|jgi:acyl carrier protein